MKKFNQNIFNWVVVILLVANLGFSFYLSQQLDSTDQAVSDMHVELPDRFKSFLDDFMVKFITNYNQQDADAIYNLFANGAKVEINKQSTADMIKKLYDLTGDLTKEYAFQNYTIKKNSRGIEYYIFYYRVKAETGVAGLEITFYEAKKGELKLYGFNVIPNN